MLHVFLAWWLRQLTTLLPSALTVDGSQPGADSVMLVLAPGDPAPSVDAIKRRRQRQIPLGRFALDPAGLASLRAAIGVGRPGPIRLVLPSTALLEQKVTLPLAAERDLDSALRWEMDRLTPFTADAVFWTWRIVDRDRARDLLDLRLVLVARSAVQAVIDTLVAAGLAPDRLEAAGDPARTIALNRLRVNTPGRPARTFGIALAAAASIAAIAAPFVRQQAELDRLAARIAELRPQVDIAESLRRRATYRNAGGDVLAADAARVGDALHMLAVLTDLLPDDTSLNELSLRDRVATFSGQSRQAARLIPALAADPAIRNPVLSAAVTRDEVTRTEAFSIRAEFEP